MAIPKLPTTRDGLFGAVSGLAGTAVMDVLWYRRHKADGGEGDFADFEFSDADSFEDAGAPAQIGQRVTDVVGVRLPATAAGTTSNVVHWLTGAGWGALAGVAASLSGLPALPVGIAVGTLSVATAYGVLGPLGIYQPVWEYDGETLWKDLTAHLLFGAATGAALNGLRSTLGRFV